MTDEQKNAENAEKPSSGEASRPLTRDDLADIPWLNWLFYRCQREFSLQGDDKHCMAIAGTLHGLLLEFIFQEGCLASTTYSEMKGELKRIEKASKELEDAINALSPATLQVLLALTFPASSAFPDSILEKAYGPGREREIDSDADDVPKERWSKVPWQGQYRHVTLMKGAVQYAIGKLGRFNSGRPPLESAAELLARNLGAIFDEVKSDEFPKESWVDICADVGSNSDTDFSAELAKQRAKFVSDVMRHFTEHGVLGAYTLHERQALSAARVAKTLGKSFKPVH